MLYMLQILLAATFTALSAYQDSSRVILTVLGALNTVLAGSLAWQKGQGVPQRYRKAQDQYQALIIEIETAERSFFGVAGSPGSGGSNLDPRAEDERLQKLFDTARADQQANHPDLYVSTGQISAKETKDSAKATEETANLQGELINKFETFTQTVEHKLDALAAGLVTKNILK
ncbi:hypothetical protein LTS14_006525 [Recurvomyces mirabilis]|nr:hypothetical protein LTS14_006525 [Recurvomyces mirabilis]